MSARPSVAFATQRRRSSSDCGGSNGNRVRLWKVELQKLADETGLQIGVCHFPPGTSKWNRIEHRLFSYITINWRGKPLHSLETIVNLISGTTTSTGLEVYARLDEGTYPDRSASPTTRSKRSTSTATHSTPNRTTPSNQNVNYQRSAPQCCFSTDARATCETSSAAGCLPLITGVCLPKLV